MKSKLALTALMVSLSTCGYAAKQQSEVKCPEVQDLKSAHFSNANAVADSNLWEVGQSSQFGTKNAWNFKVDIEADDKQGAMKQAVTTLGSMRLLHGPEKIDNQWMCHYRSGQHDAVAILTPPTNNTPTAVASAKQVIAKKKPA